MAEGREQHSHTEEYIAAFLHDTDLVETGFGVISIFILLLAEIGLCALFSGSI